MRNTLSKIMNWAAEAFTSPKHPWDVQLKFAPSEDKTRSAYHVGSAYLVIPQANGNLDINSANLVMGGGTLGSMGRSSPILPPPVPCDVKICLQNASPKETLAFLDKAFSDQPSFFLKSYKDWKAKVTALETAPHPAPYL